MGMGLQEKCVMYPGQPDAQMMELLEARHGQSALFSIPHSRNPQDEDTIRFGRPPHGTSSPSIRRPLLNTRQALIAPLSESCVDYPDARRRFRDLSFDTRNAASGLDVNERGKVAKALR